MQKMMPHDKINERIKERRTIHKISRKGRGVEGQNVINCRDHRVE